MSRTADAPGMPQGIGRPRVIQRGISEYFGVVQVTIGVALGLLFAWAAEPRAAGIALAWGLLSGMLLAIVSYRRERGPDRRAASLSTGLVWVLAGIVAETAGWMLR